MSRTQRAVLLLLAAAVVLIAVLVIPALTETGNEGDDTETTGTATPTLRSSTVTQTTFAKPPKPRRPTMRTINVRGGKPRAGVQKLSYRQGQTVNLMVTSDTADEVHVHGYDITKNVPAGGRARVRFEADAAGIFEIEMHHSGEQIASLRVNPD